LIPHRYKFNKKCPSIGFVWLHVIGKIQIKWLAGTSYNAATQNIGYMQNIILKIGYRKIRIEKLQKAGSHSFYLKAPENAVQHFILLLNRKDQWHRLYYPIHSMLY